MTKAGTVYPQIERGIPIPPKGAVKHKRRSSAIVWPFAKMRVGDSFLVHTMWALHSTVRVACSSHPDAQDKEFITRTDPGGGLRVWRVA